MRGLLLFIFTTFAILGYAVDNSYEKGNKAYEAGDYTAAIDEYNKLIGAEKMSSSLYYNLGNAYFQTQELGEAIWAYEKALKLNPKNENALFNLNFANKKTKDIIDPSGSEIKQWFISNLFSFGINFWAWLSIGSSFILAIFIYLFFTTKNKKIKNISLTLNFILLSIFFLTVIFSFYHKSILNKQTEGIIIEDLVFVKTSPLEDSPVAFELHEGTKVSYLRAQDGWVEINLNQNTGWIQKHESWGI
jgi:tetratricopeptide (TPR) repeat protein